MDRQQQYRTLLPLFLGCRQSLLNGSSLQCNTVFTINNLSDYTNYYWRVDATMIKEQQPAYTSTQNNQTISVGHDRSLGFDEGKDIDISTVQNMPTILS
jgi:hypothetical protein